MHVKTYKDGDVISSHWRVIQFTSFLPPNLINWVVEETTNIEKEYHGSVAFVSSLTRI